MTSAELWYAIGGYLFDMASTVLAFALASIAGAVDEKNKDNG